MYFYRTVDKNTLNLASTEQTIVPLGLYQVKLNPLPFSPKAIYEFDNSELRDTKKWIAYVIHMAIPPPYAVTFVADRSKSVLPSVLS